MESAGTKHPRGPSFEFQISFSAALGDQEVLPERALVLASREGTEIAHGNIAHTQAMKINFAVPGDLVAQIPVETFKVEIVRGNPRVAEVT